MRLGRELRSVARAAAARAIAEDGAGAPPAGGGGERFATAQPSLFNLKYNETREGHRGGLLGLSVLSVTLALMGGRRARERHLRESRAVPISGGDGLAGCTHFARLACLVTCLACCMDTEGLLVMPSMADVGQLP